MFFCQVIAINFSTINPTNFLTPSLLVKGIALKWNGPLFCYFESWHNTTLMGDKLRPRNWVFPTLKVEKKESFHYEAVSFSIKFPPLYFSVQPANCYNARTDGRTDESPMKLPPYLHYFMATASTTVSNPLPHSFAFSSARIFDWPPYFKNPKML